MHLASHAISLHDYTDCRALATRSRGSAFLALKYREHAGHPHFFVLWNVFPTIFCSPSPQRNWFFFIRQEWQRKRKNNKKYPRVWKRNLTQPFSGVKARFGSTCAPTTEHVECSELMLFAKTSVVIIKATNRSVTKGRGPKPQIKTPFRNMDILAVSHREAKKKCVIMSHLKFPLGIGFHRDHRDNFHQIDVKALSKVIDQSGRFNKIKTKGNVAECAWEVLIRLKLLFSQSGSLV